MILKNIIDCVNTVNKAIKFVKEQEEIKNKATTLVDEMNKVLHLFKTFVAEIENLIDKLKGILSK